MLRQFSSQDVDWSKGLIPAIIQDATTLQCLMLGYMDQDALEATVETGKATFFSRSKQRLWTKGETSGNFLIVKEISLDCDKDTLLVKVDPIGPTCHTGEHSCWGEKPASKAAWLGALEGIIDERAKASPDESYTAKLLTKGTKRIAQKVGEEGVEAALAATVKDTEELVNESADLLFHLSVLLHDAGTDLDAVIDCLQARHAAK